MTPARDPRVVPNHVGPTEDGAKLRIEWADGVASEYWPRDLRLACPCAGCVDEMTGVRTLRPDQVWPDVYPTAIHYVGRYALQFVWSDGHSTGYYTWEYLRGMAEEPGAEGA
jgi:ATP-binding protein involved in chromosome partitioning